jgi:hypothetical protein
MDYEHLLLPKGIVGASGVVRNNSYLFIVSDDAPGCYFRVPVTDESGPLIRIPHENADRHELPDAARLALDLESIDILADNRVVVLSERMRSLIDEDGLVAQYDDPFSEFAEKGLEGLAVRRVEEGASRIAVLWEGGYLDETELPAQLRATLAGQVLKPVVLIHDLAVRDRLVKVRMENALAIVELVVPTPPNLSTSNIPPFEFRAPDLVWHEWTHDSGKREWGFIVLLNSETPAYIAPDDPGKKRKKRYGPRWLQRFAMNGGTIGDPLDLDIEVAKVTGNDALTNANWEGLGWFEPGRRLVVVHDESKVKLDVPAAVVLQIPKSWRL